MIDKFWWNEELQLLKEASVELNRLWIQAGKPRDGPLFRKRQTCRMQYRKCLTDNQNLETLSYTNDLHDALYTHKIAKCFGNVGVLNSNTRPCKCGKVDVHNVSNDFADYFAKIYFFNNQQKAEQHRQKYLYATSTTAYLIGYVYN